MKAFFGAVMIVTVLVWVIVLLTTPAPRSTDPQTPFDDPYYYDDFMRPGAINCDEYDCPSPPPMYAGLDNRYFSDNAECVYGGVIPPEWSPCAVYIGPWPVYDYGRAGCQAPVPVYAGKRKDFIIAGSCGLQP